MELTKINELMRSRGFTKAIGPIFSEWEFVKDEVLLPERKAGSGNGTVHIYLQEDNMGIFRQCFPTYINSFEQNPEESEKLCPHIRHFVMTSNVITVAGLAYIHYDFDRNVFKYKDFVSRAIYLDDNGLIEFESLFKLTTENRPYFKQFDRDVFPKIIRYVFVPKKTAYKLYLYSDDDYANFACFWLIGQASDSNFNVTIPFRKVMMEEKGTKEDALEGARQRFIDYMISTGSKERTAKAYAGCLKNLIPRAWKMIDGKNHPSPFTITNLNELIELNSLFWSNPDVVRWNSESHNRASAALHMYIRMFQDQAGKEHPQVIAKPKASHGMDFMLTDEEEKQKAAFMDFLRSSKNMTEVTVTSYSNALLKKLSPVLRDFYSSDFRNVYSVTNLKTIMQMEKEIWNVNEIAKANEESKGRLMSAFRAYLDFLVSTLSDEELAAVAFGDTTAEEISLVKPQVGKKLQFVNYLPLYSIRAACGKFADEEEAEVEGWVDMTKTGIKAKEDMFVIHAKGNSMEPKIHDGDLCVFQQYAGGSRQNDIVLTQLLSHDSDYGGMYTIKKYYSEKGYDEDGNLRHSRIELQSLNPDYAPIVINEEDAGDMKTIGVFVDVLR